MSTLLFTILLVDDDDTVVDLFRRTARSYFPEAYVINAQSEQETTAYLDQHIADSPQLIILDIDLHQAVDGLTLLARLSHRLAGQVPILMFSTSTEQHQIHQAHQQGAAGFDAKPDDMQGWRSYVTSLRTTWYRYNRV